jgi:hypothetical protein
MIPASAGFTMSRANIASAINASPKKIALPVFIILFSLLTTLDEAYIRMLAWVVGELP